MGALRTAVWALVVAAAAASQDNTAHTVRNSTANSTVVQNASIASNHTTAANQSTLSKPGPVGNETVGADHHPANQTIAKEPVTNQTVANQTVANQTVANQTVANQTAGNQTVANQTVSGNSSIHPVVIRGNMLYDSVTGKRFFAKGVAYNPRNGNYGQVLGAHKPECVPGQPKFPPLAYYADPAADDMEAQFKDYLPLIADLGANVIRLYNIDPEKSHRKFMEQAASLGLYVMVPLTRGDWGFLPALPSPQCYFEDLPDYGHVGLNLLTSAKLIVDQFSKYENTFMFVVGNEIDHLDRQGYAAYPCVKALTRDMHRYQKAEGYRRVPLIYSNKDQGNQDRLHIAEYLTCELESPDDAVDAFGLNVYSWCDPEYYDENGAVNFRYSPYQNIVKDFSSFAKPFLFTEFGCNIGTFKWECPDYRGGRTWTQLSVMADKMIDFVSGAVAFEFSMENNEFGLVLTPGFLKDQTSTKLTDSYFALQKQFKKGLVKNVTETPTPKAKPTCISQGTALQLQRRQHVSQVSDWTVLPETPMFPETTLLP